MILSEKNVRIAEEIYKNLNNWKVARDVITSYFNKNNLNVDKNIVLIKVVLIDSLYKTNLKEPIIIAEGIYNLSNIDQDLKESNLVAVERIRRLGKKDILSFASKFCHFHNKQAYPIYDKYVCNALKKLINYDDKRDYLEFTNKIKSIGGNHLNFEGIDTFLWIYGQKLELDAGKTMINKEIKSLYNEKRVLFNILDSV